MNLGDPIEYQGSHNCLAAKAAFLESGLAWGRVFDRLHNKGLVTEEDYQNFVEFMDLAIQASYDRGYDDGQGHVHGLTYQADEDLKDAVARRRWHNRPWEHPAAGEGLKPRKEAA